MALVDSQDISLIINAQTTGMAGVNTLVDQINALGRSGAATGPEINRISEEIVRLGQQQVRINGLEQAIDSSKQTWKAVSEARKEVEVLDKALGDARGAGASAQAIRLLEKELNGANKELSRAEKAWESQKKALAAARAEAAGMGIDTKNVGEAQKKLAADIAAANQRVQDASRNTGASLRNAFEVVGVRSANVIETEILDVERALQRIAAEGKVTGKEFDRVWAAGQERIKGLKNELNGTGQAMDQVGSKTNSVIDGVKKLAAAYGGMQAARAFLEANVELESLRRGLTAVTGSAESAELELERLRASSNRLGVELGPLAKAYISLSAATKGSAVEGQGTREVFDAITAAMGKLGASTATTERALTAVSQMASKGVVSMEELRQQLSEALPGAADAAARGLGITKQELNNLVSSGSLLAEDFLPALAKGLRETFGDGEAQVEGFAASWQRLKNTFSETAQALGDLGFMSALAGGAEMLSTVVKEVAASFVLVGKQIGVTAGAIATFDLSSPIQSIKSWWSAMGEAEREVADSLKKTGTAATESAAATQAAATAGEQAANKFAAAAPAIADTADALDRAAAAARDTATATTDAAPKIAEISGALEGTATSANTAAGATAGAGQSAELAGQQAVASAGGWVALNVAFGDALAGAANHTEQMKQLAAASEAEGKAAIAAASLLDDEAVKREVAAKAVQDKAAAHGKIVAAMEAELAVLQSQLIALEEEAKATGQLTDGKKNQLHQLQKIIESQEIEVRKSREVSAALQTEATRARESVSQIGKLEQAYKDLGIKSTESLNKMADTARQNFLMIKESGTASADDIKAAFEAYAKKAIEANRGVITAALEVEAAMHGVKLSSKTAANAVEAAFKELGVKSAAELDRLAKNARANFDKIENSGRASKEELQRAFAAYAKTAIEANNGVAASALVSEARYYGLRIEADRAGKDIVKVMTDASDATDDLGDAADRAADKYRELRGEAERTAEGLKKAEAAEKKSEYNGSYTSPIMAILDRAQQLGGWALREEIEQRRIGEAGITAESAARFWNRIEKEIRELEDKARFGDAAEGQKPANGGVISTHRVQIQFGNNKSQSINTASDEDATALVNVLQQLESAAARS